MNTSNCIFCKIIAKEIPSTVVYEDGICLAFLDINPEQKGHTLIIPKRHFVNVLDVNADMDDIKHIHGVAVSLAREAEGKYGSQGAKIMQLNGECAGQSVFHYHVHVIPYYA
jgi:histidine triad (HIT) family protein